MLVTLTGTATTKFMDMMETVFGVPEESLYQAEPTEGEAEEEDLPPKSLLLRVMLKLQINHHSPKSVPPVRRATKAPSPGSRGTPKMKRVHPGLAKGGARHTKIIEAWPIKDSTPIFLTKSDQHEGYLHSGVKTGALLPPYEQQVCQGCRIHVQFCAGHG